MISNGYITLSFEAWKRFCDSIFTISVNHFYKWLIRWKICHVSIIFQNDLWLTFALYSYNENNSSNLYYCTCHLIIKNSTWMISLFFCSICLSTQTRILQLSQWPQILRWSQLRKSMMKARIVALQLINDMLGKKCNLETCSRIN